ncbi:MAG: DNA repair protein RecO [Candidatus Omnitrophica bacterium]|nr:DNA repair protein RecO [Candidatus Omnitrophota bacterium]
MILKTPAIVLKTIDFRETSRIAIFFTQDHGKVSGLLKGIRKDPKKFGSSLERFSVNDIVFYQYRNSDLHLVSQCDMKEYFYAIRQDMSKFLAASYVAELVQAIMPNEEKNLLVFQLMLDFLKSLSSKTEIHSLVHAFQIKILLYSGFRPHLDTCLKCKKKIQAKAKFSLKDGGLICLQCPTFNTEVYMISPGTVASILHVERSEWVSVLKLRLTESVKRELKYVLNNFLVFHLGRQLQSVKYLKR